MSTATQTRNTGHPCQASEEYLGILCLGWYPTLSLWVGILPQTTKSSRIIPLEVPVEPGVSGHTNNPNTWEAKAHILRFFIAWSTW